MSLYDEIVSTFFGEDAVLQRENATARAERLAFLKYLLRVVVLVELLAILVIAPLYLLGILVLGS